MKNRRKFPNKLDLFKSRKWTKGRSSFCISSSSLREYEKVEVLKPTMNIDNLYREGTLIKIIPRKGNLSPMWEIKMDTGDIEYCEENYLQKARIKS